MDKCVVSLLLGLVIISINFIALLNYDKLIMNCEDKNLLKQKYHTIISEHSQFATRQNLISSEIAKKEMKIEQEKKDLEYLKKIDQQYKSKLNQKDRELNKLRTALYGE